MQPYKEVKTLCVLGQEHTCCDGVALTHAAEIGGADCGHVPERVS